MQNHHACSVERGLGVSPPLTQLWTFIDISALLDRRTAVYFGIARSASRPFWEQPLQAFSLGGAD